MSRSTQNDAPAEVSWSRPSGIGQVRGGGLPLLLEIAVLAAVEAALVRLDSLFTLRGHGDPMLYRRVPVQIAVLDDLADFEKPRVFRRSWLCLACRAHTAL